MIDCGLIKSCMDRFERCSQTELGLKVSTHCLYPSFEQVDVYIIQTGDSFVIHDNSEASRIAWLHGVEKRTISSCVNASSAYYGCETIVENHQIKAIAQDEAWLWAAISAVANASAYAARTAVGRVRKSKEFGLIQRTKDILDGAKWSPETQLDKTYPGMSGKEHTFDLGVTHSGQLALIDAITAHPNSIAAKFLAFSDTENRPGLFKYAVYENELSQEDKALLSNVAELIEFSSIAHSDGKFLLT